jgi:gamma-glutamylaminecyclotransferase
MEPDPPPVDRSARTVRPHVSDVVFVYGTLKEGFANFHVNAGVRVPGEFETTDRFPLYLMGEHLMPWLVDREGEGEHVAGQLFEVDGAAQKLMDALERLNEPGWYTRRHILVRERGADPSTSRKALVYFGAQERLRTEAIRGGPVSEFTSAHDQQYRRRAA